MKLCRELCRNLFRLSIWQSAPKTRPQISPRPPVRSAWSSHPENVTVRVALLLRVCNGSTVQKPNVYKGCNDVTAPGRGEAGSPPHAPAHALALNFLLH